MRQSSFHSRSLQGKAGSAKFCSKPDRLIMSKFLLLSSVLFLSSALMAQDKPAYLLFSESGKSISYKKAFKIASKAEVVCFGELHNNPIAHWLQYELLVDIFNRENDLAVGFEMFETDQQPVLDSLMSGQIDAGRLADHTRLWPNYKTDYQPVVRFCLENELKLVATNTPREYARLVAGDGPDSLLALPREKQSLLAPLPYPIDYELSSYQKMIEMISGHGGGMEPRNFVAAQALKDATMAHRILTALAEQSVVYHLNGSFHSDDKEGIVWYLTQARPELEIITLTVIESETMEWKEEYDGKADVIVIVPASMTKTY